MHLITPAQCRAARALLNWSQPDLAKRCGIHVQTISNFEQDTGSPTKKTLKLITETLKKSGVVFTEQGGVNPSTSEIVTYEGTEGFKTFMDDVYETAKQYGGRIYLFNSRPKLWYDRLGKEWYDMHAARMKALGDRIEVKITVQQGDYFMIAPFAEHRWFPQGKNRMSKDKIFYGYGPKLAFLDFHGDDLRISVITQKDFADIFRVLYDIAWERETIEISEAPCT